MSPKNPLTTGESRFVSVHYCHATDAVIAIFERDGEGRRQRSIYVRDRDTLEYERLVMPAERTSCESIVVARSVPSVFFNLMRHRDSGGSDWVHLAHASVQTRDIDVLLTERTLLTRTGADPAWPIRPWVSQLIDVSDDGTLLTCTIGTPEPRDRGAFRMNYALFELDVRSRTLRKLANFEQTPSW